MMTSHRHFYDGASRPQWAGSVQSESRQRITGKDQLTQSTELSGLVLPISVSARYSSPSGSSQASGLSLGFPHLGEHFVDMHDDLWKNWGRLEQVVGEAAAGAMGWNRPQGPHQASRAGVPENALRLRALRQTLTSTGADDTGRLLRPDSITGEVSKMFAIRDVSGSQLRFESACAGATFRVTPAGVHWSRDPRTL